MRKKILLFLVALTATMWSAAKAQSAGTVDTSWGTNGVVQTAIGSGDWIADIIQEIATYPNGKIIAVGSTKFSTITRVALVRYNADGSLDNTFGKSGSGQLVLEDETDDDSYFQTAADVKILEDGKILVCGRLFDGKKTKVLLLKFNDNGSLDTSFGDKGIVKDEFPNGGMALEKMALQSDGKIVVGGYHQDNLAAVRYNADGSRDNTYGNQGMCVLIVPNSTNFSFAKSMDIQADNKVILGGFYNESSIWKWVIARINTDGTIDTSFGDSGIKKMSIGSGNDYITAVKVMPNGKILIGGHSWDKNPPDMEYSIAFVRLNEDGTLDNSFATEGKGIIRKKLIDKYENYLTDIVVNQDGKIYGSVNVRQASTDKNDIGIISLTKDGKLNNDFGSNGMVITDVIKNSSDESKSIALQSDGKIIVGTLAFYGGKGSPFTLVRYHSDSNVGTDTEEVTSDIKTITVYPNPTKEILNIAINETLNSYKVQIFDMAGSIVMTTANTKTIDVSKLDSGNYIVKVICADKQVFVSRFTKK